jgi:hypothetical protein
MMKHRIAKNVAASEAHEAEPALFAKLKTVYVTPEESDKAETWRYDFIYQQETLLPLLYLPVVDSLQLLARAMTQWLVA